MHQRSECRGIRSFCCFTQGYSAPRRGLLLSRNKSNQKSSETSSVSAFPYLLIYRNEAPDSRPNTPSGPTPVYSPHRAGMQRKRAPHHTRHSKSKAEINKPESCSGSVANAKSFRQPRAANRRTRTIGAPRKRGSIRGYPLCGVLGTFSPRKKYHPFPASERGTSPPKANI